MSINDNIKAKIGKYLGSILDPVHFKNDQNVEMIFVGKDSTSDDLISFEMKASTHYFLYVEASCEAVASFAANESACLEVYLEEDAKLELVLSRIDKDDTSSLFAKAKIEKGARIDWFLNLVDCEVEQWFVQTHVAGEEATSNINLAFYGEQSEQMKIFAGNIFDAKNGKGKILAKGVVADKSKVGFVGEIDITLKGGGTDSYLKEDVLMLDSTAKIDAIPSLEIKTNDVKAGHGVSISRLNEDKMFYLTSRGIAPEVARKLVLAGFLRDLYSKCSVKEVVELLESKMQILK